MDKDTLKKYTTTIWNAMNLFLVIATIITTIAFLVLFILCFTVEIGTDCHGMILGMCGVFASLASAFFIAWIVRIYDFKKRQNQESKALEMIRPYLATTFATINRFFPQLKSFAKIDDDDHITFPEGVIYYTDPGIKQENRSFVELKHVFADAKSRLDGNLKNCLADPIIYQCNEEVIKLMTGLKLNGLTQNLMEIYGASLDPFFKDTSFMGLQKNYNEFNGYYEELAKLVLLPAKGKFVELSDGERDEYIKEIEHMKTQLQTRHKGEIYRGYVRIQ